MIQVLPSIKEEGTIPAEQSLDLRPFIDTSHAEKIHRIKIEIKKGDLASKIEPANFAYYN